MTERTLWWIWIVGFMPVLLAVLVYFSGVGQPDMRTYQGELLVIEDADREWQLERTGQWQLVLVPAEECRDCVNWSRAIENLHTALGRDQSRVKWQQIENPVAHSRAGIYLFDPHGTLVFRYSLEQTPQQVLADLERLLKLSKIG